MTRSLILSALVVVMSACGADKADAFRQGVPKASAVELKLPGSGNALSAEGTRRDGLEGQTSDFYRFTRGVTVFVNGGTAAVLNLVHRITQHPATTVTSDTAVWGPHTEALSPNTWKLTVTRTATDSYTWALEGRGKTEADSAFRVVLSGSHVVMGDEAGAGTFLIDFDQAHTLPENDGNVGTVSVTYSRPSLSAATHIDADFVNVKDGTQLVDARYRYLATPGAGGTLDFEMDKDFVEGAGVEHGVVRSRWLESGAGRSDVQASRGDLQSAVTLNECWDSGFASRYQHTSFAPSLDYGAESVCAFTTAQYATFAP